MSKKLFHLFIGASCFITTFLSTSFTTLAAKEYCAFCDQAVLDRQTFYEDDLVLALYTHQPVVPSHCLVIPRRHVNRFEELTDEEMVQMGRVIKKVNQASSHVFNTVSYVLLQKNGREAGQSVPHVHFHYMGKKEGDTSTMKFLTKFYMTNFKKPISYADMQKVVAKMSTAMLSLEHTADCTQR